MDDSWIGEAFLEHARKVRTSYVDKSWVINASSYLQWQEPQTQDGFLILQETTYSCVSVDGEIKEIIQFLNPFICQTWLNQAPDGQKKPKFSEEKATFNDIGTLCNYTIHCHTFNESTCTVTGI